MRLAFALALVALALNGGAGQTVDPLRLNPAQAAAQIASLSRESLDGVRSVRIFVDQPKSSDSVVYDPKPISDAIELELRRTGIKVDSLGADATLNVSIAALQTHIGGEPVGFCAHFGMKVQTLGYSEGWRRSGILVLYDAGQIFTRGGTSIQKGLEEAAAEEARDFCLAWLRQNPKG